MISIQTLAVILLVGRIVSIVFMALVIWKQIKLLRLPIEDEIRSFRKLLFFLSWVIMLGNVIPFIIDFVTIVSDDALGRNPFIPAISTSYSLSNSATAAVSAFTLWLIYRTSDSRK